MHARPAPPRTRSSKQQAVASPEEVGPLHILGQAEVCLQVLRELAAHKVHARHIIVKAHLCACGG